MAISEQAPGLHEKVLDDRIKVDTSEKKLAQTKKDVASGKATKADYDKQAADHAKPPTVTTPSSRGARSER